MTSRHSAGRAILVPRGFETDGASVPRMLWPLFPPLSDYSCAALVHDYLYETGFVDNREACDKIFLEAMKFLGLGRIRRGIMYRGVRLGGGRAWRRYRNG